MSGERDRHWQEYMRLDREELAKRAEGQLGNALGPALLGEIQEELNRLATEDVRLAREGLVELRSGEAVWHKPVEELTREDRPARLEAEKVWLDWLRSRVERRLEEQGRYPS
jgi:hypothetical protein